MVFSSALFIFGFLPVFFLVYFLVQERWRNAILLIGSILFYTAGAGSVALVLLASVWLNQFLALTSLLPIVPTAATCWRSASDSISRRLFITNTRFSPGTYFPRRRSALPMCRSARHRRSYCRSESR